MDGAELPVGCVLERILLVDLRSERGRIGVRSVCKLFIQLPDLRTRGGQRSQRSLFPLLGSSCCLFESVCSMLQTRDLLLRGRAVSKCERTSQLGDPGGQRVDLSAEPLRAFVGGDAVIF